MRTLLQINAQEHWKLLLCRTGTVYRNTDNIAVCLLKNGYRFLH